MGNLKIESQFEPTYRREQVRFVSDDKPYLQVYSANSIQDPEIHTYKSMPIREYIDLRRNLVHDHIDRRIQFSFMQYILCHNTPFYYEAFGAEDQIGAGLKKGVSTQGAHSSTLPCLYASPLDENGHPDTKQRFVFGRHSHYYTQQNATVELIDAVNGLDTFLDGNQKDTKTERLRTKALKIVNLVAQGRLSPTKGTKRFLELFDEELKRVITTLPESDDRHYVATIYRDRLAEVREGIENSKETFDYIMGLKVAGSDDEKKLRKIVYKERYKMIQEAQRIESQIARKILDAQNEIFKTRLKSLKRVDNRLRYILLSDSDGELRETMEKWFCTSKEQLEAIEENKRRAFRSFQTKVCNVALKKEYPQTIERLKRDLRHLSRDLSQAELTFRSRLFRNLRVEYKGWTQREFVSSYKKLYSDAMSQSMVSRLEQPSRLPTKILYLTPSGQRRKELNREKVEHIAGAFGIDPGLLIHGFVA